MSVTLITPTADRPKAFALCEKWMGRQTFKDVQWIVVDGGESAVNCTMGQEYIRNPFSGSSIQNFTSNLREGVKRARADKILIIEDDDWYSPNYVEVMVEALDTDLVGQIPPRYYNIRTRKYRVFNVNRASLCCTGFRSTLIPAFLRILDLGTCYVDIHLWRSTESKKVIRRNDSVGIKGLPGKAGLAPAHLNFRGTPDKNYKVLRQWIGADAALYENFYFPRSRVVAPKKSKYKKVQTF